MRIIAKAQQGIKEVVFVVAGVRRESKLENSEEADMGAVM